MPDASLVAPYVLHPCSGRAHALQPRTDDLRRTEADFYFVGRHEKRKKVDNQRPTKFCPASEASPTAVSRPAGGWYPTAVGCRSSRTYHHPRRNSRMTTCAYSPARADPQEGSSIRSGTAADASTPRPPGPSKLRTRRSGLLLSLSFVAARAADYIHLLMASCVATVATADTTGTSKGLTIRTGQTISLEQAAMGSRNWSGDQCGALVLLR